MDRVPAKAFETQLENLQNDERFYYLSRMQGMNLLDQLEPKTFADLIFGDVMG